MSPPWFFHPDLDGAGAGDILSLAAEEAHHATRSLRLRPGDELTLFDGAGRFAIVEQLDPPAALPSARRRTAPIHPVRILQTGVQPPPPPVTLATAACKGERLDWLVEKATELGVWRLVLIHFERSIVRTEPRQLERSARTALAACKQSRRAWQPLLSHAPFENLLTDPPLADPARHAPGAPLLLADPRAAAGLADLLAAAPDLRRSAIVIIGPEGGLSDPERAALHERGARPVRLADGILRVETAALAAAAVFAAGQPPDRPAGA
jgi:16S rRNA (uracil1498-N3)-methyltransferase